MSAVRNDRTLSNNVSVQYGEKSISELNASLAKHDSSTVFGILALVTGQATEVVDGRIVKSAAFGTDKKVVGEALSHLADNLFGFDSVNGKKAEQKHNAQIKRCAVVATYLMDGFAGSDLELRVKMSAKGSKLIVAGRFLIEDSEDAEYDQMITITGARGRALADLDRSAKAWFKKASEVPGSAQAADDTRKKNVGALTGSVAGQAKLADVLTEELAKLDKKGEKLNKELVQSFANLKAQIAAVQTDGNGDDDSDILGCISEIESIIPHVSKHDEVIQDALYALYMSMDELFSKDEAGVAIFNRNELKAA